MPAEITFRKAFGSFHTPVDVIVLLTRLLRPCPHIVQAGSHKSVFVLIGILYNAVGMLKFCSRIGPAHCRDLLWIAEEIAENIQMMHRHCVNLQLMILLQEGLPVRYRTHINRSNDRLADQALVQNPLHGPHRLVITHVGVDCDRNARFIAQTHDPSCFLDRHCNRLLA